MTDTRPLSPDELAQLTRDLDYMGLLVSFPWHRQQRLAMAAATNTVVILGGNQSGKSQSALGIVSRLVRREGPIYRRLRLPEHRPLKIWVAPKTGEKFNSLWEPRLIGQVFHGLEYEYKQSPSHVFTWDDSCAKGNTLWGKSQDQGFLAFESDEVDLIIFDEEPEDKRLYTSAVQRFSTTNGVLVFAFTPLLGMSWTYGAFHVPTVKGEFKVADRCWKRGNSVTVIQMGMADNPAAVAGGGVARLQNDPSIAEAERQTRLFGKYGFAQGLIFPEFSDLMVEGESPYLLDSLPTDRPYSWYLLCDPNKRHGALLVAVDHEENRYYAGEHYAESLPDSQHAVAYEQLLRAFKVPKQGVSIWADPGGAGAQAIVNLAEVGIFAQPVPKDAGSVKASIERLRRAAWIDPNHTHPVKRKHGKPVKGAPHVYFLRGLSSQWTLDGVEYRESRLMWEFRQYRQKEAAPPDTPIKALDDLVDPARYLELVRPFAPEYVNTTGVADRQRLDRASRSAHDEFDEVVKKLNQPKTRIDPWD